MKKNFYEKLPRPFYAMAPMAGITDSAFRQICKDFGADVVYSEMASSTALIYNPKKTLEMLKFSEKERPYVIQLFGSNPLHFAQAVKLVEKKIKPDGIDINFGCPVPKVARQKAGAELFKDLKLSRAVIKSVIDNTKLPVSIKTRAKVGEVDVLKFLKYMNGLDIKAIMIHGRTFSQGFTGPVDWKIIKEAKKYFPGVIIANGGVKDWGSADELLRKSQADGIGVGQGALGRPWVFYDLKIQKEKTRSEKKIFKIILKHANLAYKLRGRQGIVEMRKHLCRYVQGLTMAKNLRKKLIKAESPDDVKRILISESKISNFK